MQTENYIQETENMEKSSFLLVFSGRSCNEIGTRELETGAQSQPLLMLHTSCGQCSFNEQDSTIPYSVPDKVDGE